jgi:hypothetical protein
VNLRQRPRDVSPAYPGPRRPRPLDASVNPRHAPISTITILEVVNIDIPLTEKPRQPCNWLTGLMF